MNRTWLNFVVDVITALAALNLVWTGLLMYFILPPGSGHGKLTLFGLDRHAWGDVHFWTSVVVLALVVLHVALHWSWICTMVSRMFVGAGRGKPSAAARNVAGLAAVFVIAGVVGAALWGASTLVVRNDTGRGEGRGGVTDIHDDGGAGGHRGGGQAAGDGQGWRGGRGPK